MPKDIWKTWRYWHQAAKQNEAKAQFGLGSLYNGILVKDLPKAKYFFGIACKNGETKACDAYQKLKAEGVK